MCKTDLTGHTVRGLKNPPKRHGRRTDRMTTENDTLPASHYQVFELLSDEAYAALKRDIQKNGIRVPAETDEAGNILDGHNRAKIAQELGIDYPKVVRTFETEAEKIEYAIKMNLLRRHVGPLQWARAFSRLMQARGISRRRKHNRHTPRPATIAALAAEVGVKERTARDRLQLLEELEAYPDLAQRVDIGELTAKAARREKIKRESKVDAAKKGHKQKSRTTETHGTADVTRQDVQDTDNAIQTNGATQIDSAELISQDTFSGETEETYQDTQREKLSVQSELAVHPGSASPNGHTLQGRHVDFQDIASQISTFLANHYPDILFNVSSSDNQVTITV